MRRVADAEEAMQRATAALSEEVYGRSVEPSPYGPVVWIDYINSEDSLGTWLSVFAASLEGAGWSGRVGAHPQAWFPEWLQNRQGIRRGYRSRSLLTDWTCKPIGVDRTGDESRDPAAR